MDKTYLSVIEKKFYSFFYGPSKYYLQQTAKNAEKLLQLFFCFYVTTITTYCTNFFLIVIVTIYLVTSITIFTTGFFSSLHPSHFITNVTTYIQLTFFSHFNRQIISQKDEHCWIGELNGLRGWFPAKFVQVLDERSKEVSRNSSIQLFINTEW